MKNHFNYHVPFRCTLTGRLKVLLNQFQIYIHEKITTLLAAGNRTPLSGDHVTPFPPVASVIPIREVSSLCNSFTIIINHRHVITEGRWPYTTILTINFML